MPIPTTVADLSTTASANSPAGSESPNQLDDYHRALAAIVRQVSDAKADTSHTQAASTISDSTAAGRALLTAADAAAQRTALGLGTAATSASSSFATSGAVTGNGNTMATARILGRTTAGTGAIEEISISGGSLSGGVLTLGGITLGTSVSSTSGTAIDFTGIPSTVKRVVLMFNGVSTNGTSNLLVQIGSGSVSTTGYNSAGSGHISGVGPSIASSTSGFVMYNDNAGDTRSGRLVIEFMGSNTYVCSHNMMTNNSRLLNWWGAGVVGISGALDRVRITSVSGDTFDAGSINIMYE